jgi:hypothetical protein
MLRLFLLGVACACACGTARAERATGRYAPLQVAVARQSLDRARAEAALNDYESAARFAAQATLDARLAWSMTESAALRRSAAEVAAESARLVRSLGVRDLSAADLARAQAALH